ncbi:hypothetical protein [Streptomyces sp. 8N706]|uniref:hypothetical protein n=1 Tax=Streptomyces sp. 8N706 TaxID=3457416 RepID=UPI003FD30276
MPKPRNAMATGPDESVSGAPPLPDLTGVDLRTLRETENTGLAAAVEDVMRHPSRLTDLWYEGEDSKGR